MEFKAGMEKVDIDSINSMLKEFSVGTHFQEKLDRDFKKTQEYIGSILNKLDSLPDDEEYHDTVDQYIEDLKESTDQSRVFIHIDMDAFYANVEEMDNQELKGHPVAVGSIDMLVTSNYEARKFGVRSGLPGLLAMKLCPHLIILPSRMDRYREVSAVIRNIFAKYDPNYVSPSLDEGCIDITDYLKNNKSLNPIDVANSLQADIYNETTLTSSMGISCSPLLSKICSEINKPNGFFHLDNSCTQEFIKTIQIKKLPGIGKVRQELLKTLGLVMVSDIIDHRYELYHVFPEQHRDLLFKHALAVPIFPSKSSFRVNKKKSMISKEKNCKELYDENDLKELMNQLHSQCIEMLKNENKYASSLIVKIQDFSFKVTNYTFSLISTSVNNNNNNSTNNNSINNNSINNNSINNNSINNNNGINNSPVKQKPTNTESNESFIDDEYSTEEQECIIKEEFDYFIDNSITPPSSPLSSSSSSSSLSSNLVSPNKKKRQVNYPNNFNEHTDKIWTLFNQAVSHVKFESIRCLGLKLCNLIERPDDHI